jgi:hypothetical protein
MTTRNLSETELDYMSPKFTGSHDKPIEPPEVNITRDLLADPESGMDNELEEAKKKTSTERVRRYYRRNRKKVRAYLRKTQDDRVARNRDRKKAIKKHGKKKMKNHDVHHPNGPNGGSWRLAKKDHGPDKKNESVDKVITCNTCNWSWALSDGGKKPFLCHKCGKDNSHIYINELFQMLTEGGAAGHMAHPYEDGDLTFRDMKDMIHRALVGSLDAEEPVTEKLDGQNIAFTVKDGKIFFARNKGQVKNKGQNALDVAGIRSMFAGRGNIEKAFTAAAADLEAAFGNLSEKERQAMFEDGAKFMNVEIIFPDTKNVIPYDKAVLVFHGTIQYDEDGNEVGRNQADAKTAATALQRVNANKQETFGITGPHTIAFSDTDTLGNRRRMHEHIRRLQRLQNEFDIDDDMTIDDYKREWWRRELDSVGGDLEFTDDEINGMVERWAVGDKSFGVNSFDDPEKKKWFREFERDEVPKLHRTVAQPLERTFLQVGTEAMMRVSNFLAANNPKAAEGLKKEVLDTIRELQQTDDQNKLAKLQQQVERLENLGIDNIVPSEGVVFMYKGKPYKFTGTFAPVNQILGTLKFDKGEAKVVKPEESPAQSQERKMEPPESMTAQAKEQPVSPSEPQRTVAVFVGRFQPFHSGHYSVYKALVDQFGKENVYIGSSDVTDPVRSPFGFKDKQDIITTMFDVPADRVVQVKNPYAPIEILEKLPPTTRFVTAVSQKDADRLGRAGRYFKPFDPESSTAGYGDEGYFVVAPEFQLSVNGKNISGTQLRQVMGDPKVTDRAKKEIFTKVYGTFNPDIFKKIVHTTTESEEARELTQQYGKGKKKKVAKPKQTALQKKLTDNPEMKQRVQGVLRQRIMNPETKRQIFVATALGYDTTHPARMEAERRVRAALKQRKPKNEVLVEAVEADKPLSTYLHTREYTPDELDRAANEYFDKEVITKTFPSLAKDKETLMDMVENAPTVVLSKEELREMENSEVGSVIDSDDKIHELEKIDSIHFRDVKELLKAIKKKEELQLPVIIKHDSGHYLLTGNTRLSTLAALNATMPVKLLTFNGLPADASDGSAVEDRKYHKKARNKLFSKVMQMRIKNPETGNMIKVDTAMDYKKTHPAHAAALSTVRRYMKDVSTRAGIPKKRTK